MKAGQIALLILVLASLATGDPRRSSRRRSRSKGGSKERENDRVAVEESSRQGRVFSLFSVVSFANSACQTTSSTSSSTSTFRNGTCLTSSECTSQGGSAQGNCAAGFGVCCLFTLSATSSTVTQNCTYIQNPGFPTAYTQTSGVSYTINKATTDVCFLRLDLETFSLTGPVSSSEATGGTCTGADTFVATVTTGQTIPTICGSNQGQHMYLDVGAASGDSATLAFTFTGASTTRTWEIKVTQIECANGAAPPTGCLQYTTGLSGRFTTFNFAATGSTHLAQQAYTHCIRPAAGMCCVRYSVCSDTNSYSLDNSQAIAATPETKLDTSCSIDFLTIEGASATCTTGGNAPTVNKICGNRFSALQSSIANDVVCDCSAPFSIGVTTDNTNDPHSATNSNRGVCLEYQQLPC